MRAALKDVGAEETERPGDNETNEEGGVDVENPRDREYATVEKDDAEFDNANGENGENERDLHVLFNALSVFVHP